jgi:glycine/D-amino acid oxidase-like deaminating enzyme/bacterioferritin-associated ferredoxin
LAEIRKGSAGLEAHLLQVSGAKSRVISADAICMGGSFAPQVELARLLGCTVKVEDGLPIPDRDAACRTSVPGVWIAGDAGGLGGAQLALAQGRIAGIDVLKTLGKSPRPEPALAGRVAAIKRFQTALWRLYEPSARQGIERRDDLYLCRCESVSSEQVGCAIAGGAHDLGAIKRATRLGMGRCQGRYCTRPALAMLKSSGNTVGAAALMAPQLPARPLPIHDIALEKPEWAGHKETSPSARPAVAVDQPLALDRADLVVIGGGVTGLAATLYAARQGASVICIDRGRLGAEASGGNAGSLHLQLLSWDFGSKAFAGGSAALQTLPLQKQSIDLWGEVEAELGADFEMKVTGGLMVAENPKQIDFLRAKTKAEGSVGITSEVLNGTEIRALMPHISEHIVAGAWCPGEGKINPLPATMALARAARALGAVIEEMAPAIGLSKDGKDYIVQTSRGSVRARKVIIAAGGWSSHPARFLGVDLPIRGAPLQMLVTEPAPPMVPCLLAHADRHLSMKQAASGSILIGGAWTATTSKAGQTQVLADSIEGSLWVAAHTVPAVGGLSLVRSWAAMTIDIDGAPLLSQLPGHPDVVVAATSNGFTLGPLMGREAATLALKGVVGTGLSQFNLDRF